MRLLFFLRKLILITCTVLVVWQGSQSIAKYLDEPQTSSYTLEKLADQEIMPICTICLEDYWSLPEIPQVFEDCEM